MADQSRRQIAANLYDTSIGLWQDDANDPTLRAEIYKGLIRSMRSRGWTIGVDPEVHQRHRCISPDYRLGRKGDLRVEMRISGRVVQLDFWAETWPIDNRNGRRYDFSKLERFQFLDRLRFTLEKRRIIQWVTARADVTVTDRNERLRGPGSMTAMERIEKGYRESWHSDKTLGRPVPKNKGDDRSGDGHLIEQGSLVWIADRKGRYLRGRAFYNLNNMWWVVCGRHDLHNVGSFQVLVEQPEDLRRKRNGRLRRTALERKLQRAIGDMDFRRAETLKRILFGDGETVRIWSRKNSLWYGPDCCGYADDRSRAGLYTMTEAEREVRRVPHILEIVRNDGARIRFDEAVAA